MSKRIFLVSMHVEIPVVADSEEEAREYLLEDNPDILGTAITSIAERMVEEDEYDDLLIQEITTETVKDSHTDILDLIPWGDDSDETIEERLHADDEVVWYDDENDQ